MLNPDFVSELKYETIKLVNKQKQDSFFFFFSFRLMFGVKFLVRGGKENAILSLLLFFLASKPYETNKKDPLLR